jgi:hypothetical protein
MDHFYYLSELGEVFLPNRTEIDKINSVDNRNLLVLLDSCVCLDIVNFVKYKKSAQVDKSKIFNLIDYIQKNNVQTTPIFALAELCYDRRTLVLKEDKLWDIKNKIDFALRFPIKKLKQFNFDYDKNYQVYSKTKTIKKSIEPLMINLKFYYAGLLKIREIASQGLKKEHAEKNIISFIDWMTTDLGILLGLEYCLALEVFGGNTKFLKMIKLDSTPEKAKKAMWSTSWDLFHARMSCNRSQLDKMVGKKTHPIFVTKDYDLYKLMAPHVKHSIKFSHTKINITTENSYPNHFSNSFMEKLNEKIIKLSIDRIEQKLNKDNEKINLIIQNLEEKLSLT